MERVKVQRKTSKQNTHQTRIVHYQKRSLHFLHNYKHYQNLYTYACTHTNVFVFMLVFMLCILYVYCHCLLHAQQSAKSALNQYADCTNRGIGTKKVHKNIQITQISVHIPIKPKKNKLSKKNNNLKSMK